MNYCLNHHIRQPSPSLLKQAQQLRFAYHTQCVTEAQLLSMGQALWQLLEIEEILPTKTLTIQTTDSPLDSLPWECLHHPTLGFLAKHPDYTFSRLINNQYNKLPPPPGPLNILLCTAQPNLTKTTTPSHFSNLFIEIEQNQLFNSLATDIAAGKVHFYAPDDGRFRSLLKILSQQTWHLVILSGHVILARSNPHQLQKIPHFLFENENGGGELISAITLTQIFRQTKIQCLVVAACQSLDLVKSLVQAGIPYGVGMREPLLDRAGYIFVHRLCLSLAQQTRIDIAVQQARDAMTQLLSAQETWQSANRTIGCDPSIGQWNLPTLFTHDPTQPLVNQHWQPQPQPLSWLGSAITLPKVFIGRRDELRTLGEKLSQGSIQRLLIHGIGGIGKTALAGRLALPLIQQGYRVLVYQAHEPENFIHFLTKHHKNLLNTKKTKEINIATALAPFLQDKWLIWLDNLDQHPRTGQFNDPSLLAALTYFSQQPQTGAWRLLLTSRYPLDQLFAYEKYHLQRPNFTDFSRYLQYLGFNPALTPFRKIYQILGGNFQGAQLLRSLPDSENIEQQLRLAYRYLQAYLTNGEW